MKKRLLITVMAMVMAVSSFSGCGSKADEETAVVDMNKDWSKEYDHYLEQPGIMDNISLSMVFVSGPGAKSGANVSLSRSGKNIYMSLNKVSGSNVGASFGIYVLEDGTVIAGAGKDDIEWLKTTLDDRQKEYYLATFDQMGGDLMDSEHAQGGVSYIREETDLDGTIYDVIGGHEEKDGTSGDYEYFINRKTQELAKIKVISDTNIMQGIITKIDGIDVPKNVTEVEEQKFVTKMAYELTTMMQ